MRTPLPISALTLAAGASLVLHALALATFSLVRVQVGAPRGQVVEMNVYFEEPPATRPSKEPLNDFEIGRPDASGYATHSVGGQRQQVAREAPLDQPSLSLDPVGESARVETPSEPKAEAPGPSLQPAPRAIASAARPIDQVRAAVESIVDRLPQVVDADSAAPPAENRAPVTPEQVVEASSRPPVPPAPPVRRASGSGADPAPQSDSEVDPFSVLGSAQFRAGKVTVQSGRQVKTRRPKIRLAGMVDLFENSGAQVVLRVAVDATGKVTDAQIAKSSGSNEVDQPCRVAMYEWWFEPKKDPDGRPVPDVFQFAITFR